MLLDNIECKRSIDRQTDGGLSQQMSDLTLA